MACKRCGDNCRALDPEWELHGRHGTYTTHGCRCDACREANAEHLRDWRASRPRSLGASRSRSDAAQDREDAMTDEERQARAFRSWEARRRKAAERGAENEQDDAE